MLWKLFIKLANGDTAFVDWEFIRDTVYKESGRTSGVTGDLVNKLGKQLKRALELEDGNPNSPWKLSLESRKAPAGSSIQWKLAVSRRNGKHIELGDSQTSNA